MNEAEIAMIEHRMEMGGVFFGIPPAGVPDYAAAAKFVDQTEEDRRLHGDNGELKRARYVEILRTSFEEECATRSAEDVAVAMSLFNDPQWLERAILDISTIRKTQGEFVTFNEWFHERWTADGGVKDQLTERIQSDPTFREIAKAAGISIGAPKFEDGTEARL
jgi:hypothetical protein